MHVFDSFGGEKAMRGDDERSEGFFSYVRGAKSTGREVLSHLGHRFYRLYYVD